MPYFTKEQEERAVALILEECNFCDRGNKINSGLRNMSYVERDLQGYVVGLVDLGLHHLPRIVLNDENCGNSSRQTRSKTITSHWSMPPAIGYLTRLRKLTVYHCNWLPREIFHLSDSLQEIAFHFCEELDFDALPKEFDSLQQLNDFRIHGKTKKSQRILPIHRLKNFSNLRYLYYRGGPSVDSNDNMKEKINGMLHRTVGIPTPPNANFRLIQDLVSNEIKFKKSLEILEIEGGDLTELTIAYMFSEVLPQYPNLKRLILPSNNIRSLTPIIAQQPPVIPPTVRLRCFNLLANPVLNMAVTSPRSSPNKDELLLLRPEQTNLLRLLSLYEEISSLGHGITESALCTTEILLALDLNDGGNILLSERFKPIPLSVWPVVLERVNQRKGYYASTNVIYHLLRNGPALGKRREANSQPPFAPMTTSTDVDTDPDYGIATLDSVVELSPFSQFLPSCVVVTPITTTMTMTKKRKISMP